MNITKKIVKIYPLDTAIEINKLFSNILKGESLSTSEATYLYKKLYNESPASLDTIQSKLKINKEGRLVDMDSKQRLEDLMNKIDETMKIVKTLEESHKLFGRFFIEFIDDLRIIPLTEYINTFAKVSKEEVTERYKNSPGEQRYNIENKVSGSADDLYLQRDLIVASHPCKLWRVSFYHNKIAYASMLLSYTDSIVNDQGMKYLTIEGNTLHPIPILARYLFPEYRDKMPTLNSLILPAAEEMATEINAKVIYVNDLNYYKDNDAANYGFESTDYLWTNPCTSEKTLDFNKKYVKYLHDGTNKYHIDIILRPIFHH